jgi:hypothetical protein
MPNIAIWRVCTPLKGLIQKFQAFLKLKAKIVETNSRPVIKMLFSVFLSAYILRRGQDEKIAF